MCWERLNGECFTGLITRFHWASWTENNDYGNYCQARLITAPAREERMPVCLSETASERMKRTHGLGQKVLGKISPEDIEAHIPPEWLSGELYRVDEYFKRGDARQYFFIQRDENA